MQRYKVTKQLGDGTYGSVFKAKNKQTGEVVAIKKMKRKYYTWDECLALREARGVGPMLGNGASSGVHCRPRFVRLVLHAGGRRRHTHTTVQWAHACPGAALKGSAASAPAATPAGAQPAQAAPPLHRAAEGGDPRERRAVLRFRVHGGQGRAACARLHCAAAGRAGGALTREAVLDSLLRHGDGAATSTHTSRISPCCCSRAVGIYCCSTVVPLYRRTATCTRW